MRRERRTLCGVHPGLHRGWRGDDRRAVRDGGSEHATGTVEGPGLPAVQPNVAKRSSARRRSSPQLLHTVRGRIRGEVTCSVGSWANASAELLGQADDDALRAPQEAEPIDVLVLRNLADELGAVG